MIDWNTQMPKSVLNTPTFACEIKMIDENGKVSFQMLYREMSIMDQVQWHFISNTMFFTPFLITKNFISSVEFVIIRQISAHKQKVK